MLWQNAWGKQLKKEWFILAHGVRGHNLDGREHMVAQGGDWAYCMVCSPVFPFIKSMTPTHETPLTFRVASVAV